MWVDLDQEPLLAMEGAGGLDAAPQDLKRKIGPRYIARGLRGAPRGVAGAVKILRRTEAYMLEFVHSPRCQPVTVTEVQATLGDREYGKAMVPLPPVTMEQEEETDECGHSTGGESYSGYASAFGGHKFGGWEWRAEQKKRRAALERERLMDGYKSASSIESVLTGALWGRYMCNGQCSQVRACVDLFTLEVGGVMSRVA
jgi:hypothetical protein